MITLPIVGARFRPPADEILRVIASNTDLLLQREPYNPHDANAIKVMFPNFWDHDRVRELIIAEFGEPVVEIAKDEGAAFHVGYIPRDRAAELAPILDAYGEDWPAKFFIAPHGGPMVSFEEPQVSVEDEMEANPSDAGQS